MSAGLRPFGGPRTVTPSIRPTSRAANSGVFVPVKPTAKSGVPIPARGPQAALVRPQTPSAGSQAVPFFMGAASRKRQLELAADGQGAQAPPGHQGKPSSPWQQQSMQWSRPTPKQPSGPPPPRVQQQHQQWQKPQAASAPELSFTGEEVLWLQDVELEEGFPPMAPVINHAAEIQPLLSEATHILYNLGTDAGNDVELNHDPEWSDYPQIGEALAALGHEEVALCVAICRSKSIWAVGLASNQKKRVQAARLALCIALAANAESLHEVRQRHPDFMQFCAMAGVSVEDSGEPPAPVETEWGRSQKKKRNKPKKQWQAQDEDADEAAFGENELDPAAAAEAEAAALEAEAAELEMQAGLFGEENQENQDYNSWPPAKKAKKAKVTAAAAPQEPQGPAMQRDTALWMSPLEDIPAQLQALNPEGLVLANDGTGGRKALYSNPDGALAAVLGDLVTEVEVEDDPNWDKFPGIGTALKQLSEKEECFTVAFNQTRSLWVVGVGMKGKNRHAAAKVAIAALIAVQKSEIGEDLPDLSELPVFADFVEEVRSSRDAFLTGM
eukprot:TRINITY_DN34003_c0_g1_i1.p1 TRINITY_DN34003_c0_g1~~TRINITY_DN34003_c0_g1_i1.p1  ORF type:complete len:574 (+),score=146.10 TRINITY_DN34003_c0_g1_i1:56-1723(+)